MVTEREAGFMRAEALIRSGMTTRTACGSEAFRQAYFRWKRENKRKMNQYEPALKTSKIIAFSQENKICEENSEDLSDVFPDWTEISEGRKELLRVGYKTALRCNTSFEIQAWKAMVQAVFPDRFNTKEKRRTVTPSEYKDILPKLAGGENVNPESTLLSMIEAHEKQKGGVSPESIKLLIDSYRDSQKEVGNDPSSSE